MKEACGRKGALIELRSLGELEHGVVRGELVGDGLELDIASG